MFFRYYKFDQHVKGDWELQAYVNELSSKGTGKTGGIGRVNIRTYDITWLEFKGCPLHQKVYGKCFINHGILPQLEKNESSTFGGLTYDRHSAVFL